VPLTLGGNLTPAPPGEGLGAVLATPPLRGYGGIWAIWTDPYGDDWHLSDPSLDLGWFTTNALADAFDEAPIEIVTDPLSRGGEEVRFIRSNPRRLNWPLHIWGNSHAQFLTRWRNLRRAFTATSHTGTPGTLTIYRYDTDGVIFDGRSIEAYYEEGFKIEAGQGVGHANPVLTLFCPDGFWRDIQPTTLGLSYRQGVAFLSPYPAISPGGLSGTFSLYNAGDADAWPVWQISGPMTTLTATNSTLGGLMFALSYPLDVGETATVDLSKPNRPILYSGGGQNLTGFLNWPGAVLWPLRGGENQVDLRMAGSGPGSHIDLTFYPRYGGA
jgi:hypothetical protein